jgi:quercetin dioxygenase-like cupin family protein
MSTAPKPQMGVQDPVQVDSKHYKVEVENEKVRVLRINYGAHEKSVMHSHPVRGELLFRVTTGHATLLRAKCPADAPLCSASQCR